jgi:hypothetical protein
MDGDMCRMCKRQVFDLSAMGEDDRIAFLQGCSEEICVSYRLPIRPAFAAAALAAAAMAMPAAAQDAPAPVAEAAQDYGPPEEDIFMGGIKDPANAALVAHPDDPALPDVPIVYEDEAPATPKPGA